MLTFQSENRGFERIEVRAKMFELQFVSLIQVLLTNVGNPLNRKCR